MADGYAAKVLADSVSPTGVRVITVQATFPRFILAEVNTHRVFSRNSASSRAIPPEKLIERVRENPFVPETFNERIKGMGVGEPIEGAKQGISRLVWLTACTEAVKAAARLNDIGVDKSRVNRLLEPFMWHTAIITSTEWDNFFALRTPIGGAPDIEFAAQPEFQRIGLMMKKVMAHSRPREIAAGEWHLPLVADPEIEQVGEPVPEFWWPYVSAGRCARVSYDTQDQYEEPEKSHARGTRLKEHAHLSPLEHPCTPIKWPENAKGNLHSWRQLRSTVEHESNLAAKEGRDWVQEGLLI